jgi:hypothetical protein
MEQESAIDWFFLWFIDNPKGTHEEYLEAYDKAKAMEKEQILNACQHFADYPFDENDIQQYYNETYNK